MKLGVGLQMGHGIVKTAAEIADEQLAAIDWNIASIDVDKSAKWSDTTGTTPATVGGTVARIDSRQTSHVNRLIQATADQRPTLTSEGLAFVASGSPFKWLYSPNNGTFEDSGTFSVHMVAYVDFTGANVGDQSIFYASTNTAPNTASVEPTTGNAVTVTCRPGLSTLGWTLNGRESASTGRTFIGNGTVYAPWLARQVVISILHTPTVKELWINDKEAIIPNPSARATPDASGADWRFTAVGAGPASPTPPTRAIRNMVMKALYIRSGDPGSSFYSTIELLRTAKGLNFLAA